MIVNENLNIPVERLGAFSRCHHIRKLSLFGSVLRKDFGSESDVDVLVEFAPNAKVGFFKLYDMEQELSYFFGGRRVDINTLKSLSKYFRDEVEAEAAVVYDET